MSRRLLGRQQTQQIELSKDLVAAITRVVLQEVVNSLNEDVLPAINAQMTALEKKVGDLEEKVNQVIISKATYEEEVKRLAMEMMRESLAMQLETIFKAAKNTEGSSINIEPLVNRMDALEGNINKRLDEVESHLQSVEESNKRLVETMGIFTDNLNEALKNLVKTLVDEYRKSNVKLVNTIDKKLKSPNLEGLESKIDTNYTMLQKLHDSLSEIDELKSQLSALNAIVNRLHEAVETLQQSLEALGEGG